VKSKTDEREWRNGVSQIFKEIQRVGKLIKKINDTKRNNRKNTGRRKTRAIKPQLSAMALQNTQQCNYYIVFKDYLIPYA
jgi:hypothetical protein